ncbi:hypothetical protein [Arthrobacter sp.]|uniref:hypothetical protein n=1 Tax=Arthrobacter sp. TaxID=1667 RepID=UPI0039C8B027
MASAFMRHGLIDGYRIPVRPVVLGRGRLLIEDPGYRDEPRARGDTAVQQRRGLLHCSGGRGQGPGDRRSRKSVRHG